MTGDLTPGALSETGCPAGAAVPCRSAGGGPGTQRIRGACAACGLSVRDWFASTIEGGDGNREFFVHAIRDTP